MAALAALPGGAAHAADLRALTISPARAEGMAVPGARIGPVTIRNTTGQAYRMSVMPVLVGQKTDGGLFVRAGRPDRARAARSVRVTGPRRFRLASGERRAVSMTLERLSAQQSFYGGLLFRGTPDAGGPPTQVVQVLELNARLFLSPPAALRRAGAGLVGLRAESSGDSRLRLLARVANRGNAAVRPTGTVRIRDTAGAVRFTGPLVGSPILPRYAVDLRADVDGVTLPAGLYTLEATVDAGGQIMEKRTRLRLLGPNTVATRAAKLVEFPPPRAIEGDAVKVSATYRNTGNVAFAPRVELAVSGRREPVRLDTERTTPAKTGKAEGTVRFSGRQTRELTVRLVVDGRTVDTRTVSVTPAPAAGPLDRARDWIVQRALLLVAILTGLLTVALITLARVVTATRR